MPLLVEATRLTPMTADELLASFLAFVHGEAGRDSLEIDLGRLRFIDPYGLVTLCLMGRYARTVVPNVTYHMPQAYALRRYLGRVRFAQALDGVSMQGPALVVDPEREKADSEALLEITRIQGQIDVESLLGHIGQRVEAILAEELLYTAVEINQFKNVIAELCHNILDHSMNWGYVTAQRYLDARSGKKYVVIGVGDLGIGIKKSLAQRHDVAEWSHGYAIKNSLKQHFSRDDDRGLGLYIVNQICNRYNGSLHLRTGDTRVYIRGRRQYEHIAAHFPGTQVGITLYQRDR
ncbi:MAG: ATP-binding protein [Candidatus Latescibacterota bacterium]